MKKPVKEQAGTPEEVADYIGVPLATLYGWNSRGTGPRYFRVGRHCRYRWSDVEAWLESHAHGGGSDGAGSA
ncbi:MAG: helix-turn-helix transcriptional regulator [Mycobacteriales bacterium]